MRFIYMGTADIAVKPFSALIAAGHTPLCAVTQPDKPNARGGKTVFSAVKLAALERGVPLFQPQRASADEAEAFLAGLKADVIIVCAYGQLLRKNILGLTPHGAINLHASLLPYYRGAAPINRALMNGETLTGVTVMYMDEGCDTGDMMIQKQVAVTPGMTAGTLTAALADAAAELAPQALTLLAEGRAPRTPQDNARSTYAAKITKDECTVDFSLPAGRVYDHIRGLSPRPGAKSVCAGKSIGIVTARIGEGSLTEGLPAGTVAGIAKQRDTGLPDGLITACGEGAVIIETVKPEGKALMRAADFYNGLRGREVKFGESR